jgi:hypothetical protein
MSGQVVADQVHVQLGGDGLVLRRGVHKSVAALEKDVRDWITAWNEDPTPFAWTKTAEEILNSLAKYIAKISDATH